MKSDSFIVLCVYVIHDSIILCPGLWFCRVLSRKEGIEPPTAKPAPAQKKIFTETSQHIKGMTTYRDKER